MRANSPPPPHPLLGVPTTCNSSAEDLRRARVQDARACFVLSDRLAGDTEAQDKKALVRALCANQASPPGPGGTSSVLCLVTHTKSKVRLVRLGMPPGSVVCYDEVMEGLVTNASLVSRANERELVSESWVEPCLLLSRGHDGKTEVQFLLGNPRFCACLVFFVPKCMLGSTLGSPPCGQTSCPVCRRPSTCLRREPRSE